MIRDHMGTRTGTNSRQGAWRWGDGRGRGPVAPTRRPAPPHRTTVTEIRRRIEAGELRSGDRVPPTRQIAREWGVAIATATRALTTLGQQGLVRSVPRVGTVVADRRPRPAPPARATRP